MEWILKFTSVALSLTSPFVSSHSEVQSALFNFTIFVLEYLKHIQLTLLISNSKRSEVSV